MSIEFVTHARTLEELRAEFLSDIERRIQQLQLSVRRMRPNATEATRIFRSIQELEQLQDHWKNVKFQATSNSQ